MTLTSIEGAGPEAIGVFAVKLTLSTPAKERKGFTMKAPVEGTLKIRAKDGWSTALDLSGPVEIGSPDPKKNLSGKGSLKLAYQITY